MYEPHPLGILMHMCKPRPMQSYLIMNDNKNYKVEKLSSTSCLLSATAVNQNQRKLYSSYLWLLLIAWVYLSSSDFNTAIASLKAIYF